MILTGVTKAMQEKALREEPLLIEGSAFWPPTGAVEEVAKAMHLHSCAEWDLGLDEQAAWDDLPPGAKQMVLKNATWLIGRLARRGYRIARVSARVR
jgi:hypothetical protein